MKPAKKKPVKKSYKVKSQRVTPPKKKATSKTSTAQGAGKPVVAKEKLSEASVFKKIKTENLRLTGQLEQKKRQLEIEAALESVRARTMAMQNSEELQDVANLLFKQVQSLGIPAWSCGFNIWDKGDKVCTGWMSSEGMLQPPFKIPLTESPTFIRFLESKEKGETFYVEQVGGKALAAHYQYMLSLPDFAAIAEKHIKAGYPLPSFQINHVANFRHGNLIFITSGPVPKEYEVFKRFAIVFEQTYTRFLDLQKAEAHAWETSIQLALERVRARTMAMRNSKELNEVIEIFYLELKKLEPELDRCFIMTFDPATQDSIWWMASGDGLAYQSGLKVQYHKYPPYIAFVKGWQGRVEKWNFALEGIEKKEWDSYIFYNTELNQLPEIVKRNMMDAPRAFWSCSFQNFGSVSTGSHQPLSAEAFDLLARFSKVFDLTYTRFLDLQKAEAQAREAQVEAALEKVRSVSLTMQKSSELQNVIVVVFEKLKDLGLKFEDAGISIYQEGTKNTVEWVAAPGQLSAPVVVNLPFSEVDFEESEIFRDFWNLRDKGETMFNKTYSFAEKNKYFTYVGKYNDLSQVPEEVRKFQLEAPGYIVSSVAEKNSGIWVDSWSGEKISNEDLQVLMRVAKVFEQAYTRFLDLQKAESQAREAQIETALERVRSRSLAMHKSEELKEVIQVVYEQFNQLNILIEHTGFIVDYKERDDMHIWLTDKYASPFEITIPYFDSPHWNSFIEAKEKGKSFFANQLTFDVKNKFYEDLFKLIPSLPEESKQSIFRQPGLAISTVLLENVGLYIENFSGLPYTDEENNTLMRFGNVFQQTYTRFLDLQKAEAQAREAQIEAALERVRSKTMAMHNSQDVGNTVAGLFDELVVLGLGKSARCGIGILDETNIMELWTASTNDKGELVLAIGHLDMTLHPLLKGVKKTWSSKKQSLTYELQGEDLLNYFNVLNDYPDYHIYIDVKTLPEKVIHNSFYFTDGLIYCFTRNPISEDLAKVVKRFSGVFGQTYKRYLDLRKAEAQAREAQIEAALERVRSRTMAMQRSEELADVATMLFNQIRELGVETWTTGFNVWLNDNTAYQDFVTNPEGGFIKPYVVDLTQYPVFTEIREAKLRGDDFFVRLEEGDTIKETYQLLMLYAPEQYGKLLQDGFQFPSKQYEHFVFGKTVSLMFITYEPVPEAHDIFKRFGKVFEQTYTRFLDLQRAEAQAREAQIEAALEKVRSRSLAMHKSEELSDVIKVVSDQLQYLKFRFDNVSFVLSSAAEDYDFWFSIPGQHQPHHIHVPYLDNPINNQAREARSKGLNFHADIIDPAASRAWHQHMFDHNQMDFLSSEAKAIVLKGGFARSVAITPNIMLVVGNYASKPYGEEENAIIKRFAIVFEQSYTRFLDLQKAEAQAREAQIEASLERVRGKAMAMHSSEDLAATIGVFYRELESFSITPRRCGVGLLEKETRLAELSTMNTTEQGESIDVVGNLKMQGHPVLEGIFDNWILQREYHPVLRGNEIKEYYQLIRPQIAFPEYRNDAVQYGYFFYFMEGGVYAWTEKEMTEDELKIYRRFTSVLSLTYKRYKDLKDAEGRARDAVKQAALDRVRADIASMRSTADLDHITPLIWKELTTLGIPFIRCGVFIMDEKENKVHSYLSTPDGRAIAAFHTPFGSSGGLAGAIESWRQQHVYVTHWEDRDFQIQADILISQGSIKTREQYLSTLPQGGFHLHFLPFVQGMLYVGSILPLQQDDLLLVQSLAEAFSVAYARYEDFTKLEDAKKNIEVTLSDLRAAQSQLIQSEKMASLGELTAGIAHEIQNPLNFVNNFSEVSNELLEEMHEEIEKGNIDGAKSIAKDVKQNLEKILHHGKRADGIVKGMLQHSRTGSGQREPTDINLLCDEYLRLAYHGLRAKDKSFNAKFETSFDETIGKTEVVPQDLGRVILNLINNAFYAVAEKSINAKASADKSYEPVVSVSTKNCESKILITVKDNGNGIPDSIKERIFQPFFTTKPTGQGTGLGLSLSYDIVKAHGGTIRVVSSDGKQTELAVEIPVKWI